MADNYCGKDCTQCDLKEALTCPGCKAGPGRTFGGECVTAKCCQEKGHESCATCTQNNWCGKRSKLEDRPAERLQKQKWEQEKRESLEKQMPMLAKCFTALFWGLIVANIPSLMSNGFTASYPVVHRIGQVLNLCLSVTFVGIYFLLRKANTRYRKAALYLGISVPINFVVTLCSENEALAWLKLLLIPVVVLSLLGKYHLCNAHSELLITIDYALSEKWMRLWKWYVRLLIAMAASVILMLIIALLGFVTIALAGVGLLVLSVIELIYLYRMMTRFRACAIELSP